jgi:2-dehydropantoate 2-reductase
MLIDLEAGRRTEIDSINGKIAEYGRRAGVATPYNEALLALIKAREKTAKDRRPR